MGKNYLLLKEVVFKYHPSYVNSPEIQQFALENPQHFNVELLIEEAFASIGCYNRTDSALSDFSDLSDSKTSSIRLTPVTHTKTTYRGEIRNVSTLSGNNKQGALRCIIYNPHREQLLYYFLPKHVWVGMINRCNRKTASIAFQYNRIYNDITKFVGFECDDFRELALAMDS